jgi:hypothetical protein
MRKRVGRRKRSKAASAQHRVVELGSKMRLSSCPSEEAWEWYR